MHMQTSYYPSLSAMCRAKISCLHSDMQMYWHMWKHLQSYLFRYFKVQYTYFSPIILLILLLLSQTPHVLDIFYTPLLHLNPWPVKITCNQPRGMSTLPCKAMAHSHKLWQGGKGQGSARVYCGSGFPTPHPYPRKPYPWRVRVHTDPQFLRCLTKPVVPLVPAVSLQ